MRRSRKTMKRRRSLRQRGGLSEKEQEAARQAEQLALLNADPDPVVAAAINAAAKADPNNNNKPAITDMVTQIVNQALKEAETTGKSPVAAAEAAKPAAVNAAINAGTPKGVATAAADAAVAAVAADAANAAAPAPPANNILPNGWSSAQNNDGDTYYYNNNSDTPYTTWTKPTMSAINARAARLPNGWSSAKNEDGDIYYYNNSTPQFTTRNKPIMSSVNARALAQNPAAPITLVRNIDAPVALARNAAVNAAVNAAINAGASTAVAKAAASAAVSAARKPPVLTNSVKKRLTRTRGAKLYAEIQAGTRTATPAQQACITKYEACKKPTQAGGRRYTQKSSKYHGGDKNQNMQLLKIKNSLLRVNKTAIRVKNHGNMSKLSNTYNTTHHPWNNGFK